MQREPRKRHHRLRLSMAFLGLSTAFGFTAYGCAPNVEPSEASTEPSSVDVPPPDGVRVTLWHNGNLKRKETFVRGHRQGESSYYHLDGTLAARGTFVKGRRHGVWVSYPEPRGNGSLKTEHGVKYEMGKPVWSDDSRGYPGPAHAASVIVQEALPSFCRELLQTPDCSSTHLDDGRVAIGASGVTDSVLLRAQDEGCEVIIWNHADDQLQHMQSFDDFAPAP